MLQGLRGRVTVALVILLLVCIGTLSAYLFQPFNKAATGGALAAAVVALALSLYAAKIAAEPASKLTQLFKKIGEGHLDQGIPEISDGEMGELVKAFNQTMARLREKAEMLTAERDRMAVAISHMSDGLMVVSGDSRVALINRAAEGILHLPGGRVLGHTFIEATRDHEINEIVQRCLSTRKQQTGMVEITPQKRFLGAVATPLESQAGCLLLLQDLTELRRLETVRRDFVSNITHELRTPIASLKALAETLQEGAIDDPSVAKDFLDRMGIEVDRLAQMVQELGDLSRIESGESSLDRRPLDVAEVIEHAAGRLQAQADRSGLALSVDIPPHIPLVLADKGRVEQVLVNLLHNAIKFTAPGGRVAISARPTANSVVVSVADNGIGISPDDLPRVFERFYKADRARSGGGTGLGLAIAKHIIEAHGGEIRAESVEGKGSTFHFSLPLAPVY